MKDLLVQLFAILNIGGYPIVSEFNPPMASTNESVKTYFIDRYGWCPSDVEVLYKFHDGQAFPIPVNQLDFLFDNALFLPFHQAKLYTEIPAEKDPVYQDYFTLFTSGGGEDYLIKMRGEERGSIFYLSPSEYLGEPVKAFDSLEKLVSSVIACYQTGVYRKERNQFKLDVALQMKKMAELNPGCFRWLYYGHL
jgi:hypothetical protein